MIRKAVMTDCQAIHQLIRSSFQIYKHDPVTASALHETRLSIALRLSQKEEAFVCMKENRIVGCVFFRHDEKTCSFFRLSVDPSYQGQGISKLLLKSVEKEALHRQCLELTCETREMNIPFYCKQGYQKVSFNNHSSLYVFKKALNMSKKTWQCA
ncbi:GNAT family N-acetyltransferase [Shouchella miscanthi]|uniref:GNAT family N-acetyltransferase n=1 Tax=Shouchella miscanthi TaxID=2598861 RepID=UPI0011A34B6A|nr:GNAT family N-acetyltransferase [Shouchella miscanthi]